MYNPAATENSTINVENCPYLSNLEFDDEEYFLFSFEYKEKKRKRKMNVILFQNAEILILKSASSSE